MIYKPYSKPKKENSFEIMDKVKLSVEKNDIVKAVIEANKDYISNEVLVTGLTFGM